MSGHTPLPPDAIELPNATNVDKVVVDESTIEENKPPLLVYREAAKKA